MVDFADHRDHHDNAAADWWSVMEPFAWVLIIQVIVSGYMMTQHDVAPQPAGQGVETQGGGE